MNQINSRMTEVRGINKNETMLAGIAKKAAAPAGVALAPVAVAAPAAPAVVAGATVADRETLKEKREMLSNVPLRARLKAMQLLDYMEANPNHLSLNEKFELVTHGTTVPDSNFLTLFDSLYSSKSQTKIKQQKGFDEFITGLKYVTNAGKLVGNPYYIDQLGPNTLGKQLGHGKRKRGNTQLLPGLPVVHRIYPV